VKLKAICRRFCYVVVVGLVVRFDEVGDDFSKALLL
jgi:hypothetical protein